MAVEIISSIKPGLVPLAAILASILVLLTGEKRRNLREAWSIAASIFMFLVVVSMLPDILAGRIIEFNTEFFLLAPSISIVFSVDPLGEFFAFIATSLWIVTNVYSIGYMRNLHEHNQTRYFFAFAVCVAGAAGVALAGNLVTLFIFYELLSLGAYPLVIHHESDEAMRSGRKYLFYVLFGGVLVLGASIMTYVLTGTTTLTEPGILSTGVASPAFLKLLFATFIMGFGVKAAIMPFHSWLPSAMVAPTPVSALLHAVAVVNAGVFGVTRVVYNVFGFDLMHELGLNIPLAIAASITILMGSIFALRQDNLKLRLAYSTVSQLSYMILGVAIMTPDASLGGIVHIANQAMMKITLFFCAGAIFVHTGKKKISEMVGIGHSMPITMGAFAIGAAGMIGLPPVAGFITKWYIMKGAILADQIVFAFVLVGSSLLNAAYFIPPVYTAFFYKPKSGGKKINEAPMSMVIPLVITAILSLIFGLVTTEAYAPLRIGSAAVMKFLNLAGV